MVGGDGPSRPPRARSSAIMAGPDLDTLSGLMDEAKCFALVRRHRWPDGVRCPACDGRAVIRDGHDETQPQRQRYRCKGCARCLSKELSGAGSGRVSDFAVVGVALGVEADVADRRPVPDLA